MTVCTLCEIDSCGCLSFNSVEWCDCVVRIERSTSSSTICGNFRIRADHCDALRCAEWQDVLFILKTVDSDATLRSICRSWSRSSRCSGAFSATPDLLEQSIKFRTARTRSSRSDVLTLFATTAWESAGPRHRVGPGISRSIPACMAPVVLYVPNLESLVSAPSRKLRKQFNLPIAHHQPFPLPLISKDVLQKTFRLGGMNPIYTIICRHDRTRL